ncbi:type II toxin-antitoxin system antitoxin SocA domain-containing protein [Chitinophaga pollutisoli]|uniref:Type II toxin-antitoxin system antitoxin SocA domain-containing protein n=1 Tax=Chitinophaga pollutisoli TaxID=3133966 RepID=A0ABZ2YTN8_9BACT
MYTANQIASWFLMHLNTEAGDTISPMKLQKLIYYAQAWHLALYDKPLFEDRIEAWGHGPTVPAVYKRFKDEFRDGIPFDELYNSEYDCPKFTIELEDFLKDIQFRYGEHSAGFLETLVCREVPWRKARRNARNNIPDYSLAEITQESMKAYYTNLNMESSRERRRIDSSFAVNPQHFVQQENYQAVISNGANPEDEIKMFVSITFLQHRFECFSQWGKPEMRRFWRFLDKLVHSNWLELKMNGGKSGKAGFGKTKIRRDLYPAGGYIYGVDADQAFYELRVDDRRRVHGFYKGNVFHICYLDRNHRICS